MASYKYSTFEYALPGSFAKVDDSYGYVKLPYVDRGGKKILFVLDYVPKEDLHSGRLLSGATGDLLENLFTLARELTLRDKYTEFSWLACTYNAFRTVGKSKDFQDQAKEVFADRVRTLILKYKPDVVVTFGSGPTQAFIPDKLALSSNKLMHWYGVPIPTIITLGKRSHECKIVPSISLNPIVNGTAAEASIIGYVARNIANALNGALMYEIDSKQIEAHKSVMIDTVPKFDKLLAMLKEQPHVAIDTETKNLKRITNSLLTVQFAKCPNFGYLLPMYHKDTPFMAKELLYMKGKLREYFEGDNQNEYHIYANADFDLNVLRSELGCVFMHNNVWDIFAGEYCFHPDTYVWTENGAIQIRHLVNDPNPPKVWSMNLATNEPELKSIVLGSTHTTSDRMMELEYEGGSVRITENHKVWSVTRQCYIEVKHIRCDEEILILEAPAALS